MSNTPINRICVQTKNRQEGIDLLETSQPLHHQQNTLSNISNGAKPINRPEEKVLYDGVNQILSYTHNGDLIFYIPAYLRMTVNRVTRIDYLGCRVTIDTSFRLWVMVDGLPQPLHQQILNQCELCVNGQTNFKLKDIIEKKKNSHLVQNSSKKVQQFWVRKSMELDIESDVSLSPFELIKIKGNVELKGTCFKPPALLTSKNQQINQIHLEFNFMESHPFIQFSFNELKNLGNFALAESMVGIDFSNQKYFGKMKFSVNKSGDLLQFLTPFTHCENEHKNHHHQTNLNQPPPSFSHGQICICLYKYPFSALASIFVPFYLLTVISFGIFFQTNDMNGRAISISMLLLAFFSFLPSIRSRLPPVPTFIITEFLIYLQTICMVLYFVQSLSIRDIAEYEFIWYRDIFFVVIMTISILNMATVLILSLLHRLKWEPQYHRLPEGTEQMFELTEINTDNWHNQKCQSQFQSLISSKQFSIYKPIYCSSKEIQRLSALSKRQSKKIVLQMEDLRRPHAKMI